MEIQEIFRNLVTQCLPMLQTRRNTIPMPIDQAAMDGCSCSSIRVNSLCSWVISKQDPGIWEVSTVPSITFLAISVQGVFLGLCSDGERICWKLTMALLFGAAF